MEPAQIRANYDELALWYQKNVAPTYGVPQLARALKFAPKSGAALDVGCGSEGRFLKKLIENGYETDALDISPEMVALAKKRVPDAQFYVADICEWNPPRQYALISAWDSTFHLPLDKQEPVLQKLCGALTSKGVLLFTCGGGTAGQITGTMENRQFGYSTLGVETFISLLQKYDCFCRHAEYDQWPEGHVFIIAQKQ